MNRDDRDKELQQELESHLQMAAQDRVDRGQSPADASAAALRELGNEAQIREVAREMDSWAWWERLHQDLRFAFRLMRRNPVFAVVSIATLTLGIGAATAIFSVVYGVLLRPLPYRNADKLVRLWEVNPKGNRVSFSDLNFNDLRSQNASLAGVFKFWSSVDPVTFNNEAQRIGTAYVSRDFFDVMGIHPIIGREFAPEEQKVNGSPAALVSYAYWQQMLGGRHDLSSLLLKVSNQSTPVIGVLPAGFYFPDQTQIWLANELHPETPSRTAHNWKVIGRIHDGSSLNRAQAELAGLAGRIKAANPQDNDMASVQMEPLRQALTNDVRPALLVLMAVAGLLLLVACANVTNLMLAQAAARSNELAVRAALGASRSRLIRQFLAEAFVLCACGAIGGVFLAYTAVPVLLQMAPKNIPRLREVSLSLPVLLFAIALSILVAVALGVLTAIRATSTDPQRALAEGGKSQGAASLSERTGRLIVAGQLAVTMLLLIGAGLLARSMLRVLSVDPGFRTDNIVALELALSNSDNQQRRVALLDQLLSELRTLPGVTAAGGSDTLPLTHGGYSDGVFAVLNPQQLSDKSRQLIARSAANGTEELSQSDLKDLTDFFIPLFQDKEHTADADYAKASDGYFQALGIPLKRGRLFNESDGPDSPHAAVISESLARQMWPKDDPLGHTIEFGNMDGDLRLLTVVGVVGDIREASIEAPPRPTIYVNYRQRSRGLQKFGIVVHGNVAPGTVLETARRIIRQLEPDTPVKLSTLDEVVAESLSSRRFNLALVAAFSITALLLAIVGIYGVLAYSVARRTREIGVRMALGATSSSVVRLVLERALLTAAIGVVAGAVMAFLMTRWLRSLLYNVSATDALTYVSVALILLAVALLAAFVPARRAAKIDPMIALRYQ